MHFCRIFSKLSTYVLYRTICLEKHSGARHFSFLLQPWRSPYVEAVDIVVIALDLREHWYKPY